MGWPGPALGCLAAAAVRGESGAMLTPHVIELTRAGRPFVSLPPLPAPPVGDTERPGARHVTEPGPKRP